MARQKTAATGGLGSLLGSTPGHSMSGATGRLPWWLKLAAIALAVLVAWAITTSMAQLLVLVMFGTIVCVACYTDYRLTLIVAVTLVFAILLAGTKAGPGMSQVGTGFNILGQTGTDAVGDKVQTQVGNAPSVQVTPATTTTPAPVAQPAVAPQP